jgi:5-methylcytosine-specific restriction endonuclease McrA
MPRRRTPLKRGKPLPRRSSTLKPKTPLGRGRTRAKPAQTKDLKEADEQLWGRLRHELWVRSGEQCEAGGENLNVTGMQAHHRWMRSQGGVHTIENLLAVCPACHHDRIHAGPRWAITQGYIIPGLGERKPDPAAYAVILHDGRTVRFTPDGHYDECFPAPEGGE